MLRQFVDDLDTRQISRQWPAFATVLGRRNNFFVASLIQGGGQAFCFVEERQLRRLRVACLLGLAPEQALAQQMNDLAIIGRALVDHLLKQLL